MNRIGGESEPSDAELVRRARGGDPAAFAGLVTRHQDRVYNTCLRLAGQPADALDLTQTTFLKALEALPQFEARSNFYTWLFRIATNLALSHRRSAQRRTHLGLDAPALGSEGSRSFADPDGGDVATTVAQRELLERLTAALRRLDEEFRVAVVLRDIEGMDYETIAEVLNVPTGTVKSRIHRGRLLLREMLTDEDA